MVRSFLNEPDTDIVSLVDNSASGEPFQCGTCEYMGRDGKCHNPHPKLMNRPVKPQWCCNLYDHAGMRTVVE